MQAEFSFWFTLACKLTIFVHFDLQALLEATTLALVASCNVHNAIRVLLANVVQVSSNRPLNTIFLAYLLSMNYNLNYSKVNEIPDNIFHLEETTATITRLYAVMAAACFVAANQTKRLFEIKHKLILHLLCEFLFTEYTDFCANYFVTLLYCNPASNAAKSAITSGFRPWDWA